MSSPRSLLILYATETGNAQDAADRIARQCRRIAFQCRVLSMDAYSLPDLISENLVIFVVSTTGSGTEPRSMTSLWNMLLRSDLPSDLFEDLPFAVFGLGDTAYEKFCWAAKKLARRMISLGAIEICERGEGDDQHQLGTDGALHPWMEDLLEELLELYPLPPGVEIISSDEIPPPRVSLEETTHAALKECKDPLDEDKTFHTATVKQNKRITADDWYQDVRHLEFDFDDDILFNPGDVAVIHPVASSDAVESFMSTMNWGNIADQPFVIRRTMDDQSLPDHIPRVVTLRTLFTRYIDFNSVPRRTFFQYLRYFSSDEMEREKLEEFLSYEGADELYEYCYKVRRTMHEVLDEFRHVAIPKEYVFDVFPPLRPRQFSIASSIKAFPKQIQLCVAIVKYRTKLKFTRRGICTSYLAVLAPGDSLRIGLQKGLIKLPPDSSTPVICVGPGTGLAPMRSVIQERVCDGSSANTLYFGCRSATKDQHYGREWEQYDSGGDIKYRVACSRDGPEGVKRTYVQDLIQEDAERIWKLICEKKAWVYISGSSNKMPAAVKEALSFAVEKHDGRTPEEAISYVDEMMRQGRLIEECWS
ncbi:hypothetical protein BDZ94DRAFT_1164084 [Collybia nuda]|uniref:NADPH-dependent diflavin oxidoreductase 1 n=1 Tax=Collybia nuda TaxID=64659 RepID=A0A9P5Y938_9AGAR|nr:hypothetical protein BDZ94DRAFT_1164084 [Collybia nuda]